MLSSETSYWKKGLKRLALVRRFPINPGIPLIIILAFIVVAIFAPLIAPYSPTEGSLPDQLQPPAFVSGGSTKHLLGTDLYGRDTLSRIIYGARVSFKVAALAILVSATLGTLLGLIAGYAGGWVDALIMRIVDVGLSLPYILIAIVFAVVFGPSEQNVILIIGLLLWPQFARQIRGEALSAKVQDYVALARVAGCSHARIVAKHIFPNVVPTLLVLCTLNVSVVILMEAALSFLGVGVPAPKPTWGGMVANGQRLLATDWWLSLLPGLAILFVVLSMNFFGDWLRDRLDPKLRQV
jgi:peptide/nickel transport system permease protein